MSWTAAAAAKAERMNIQYVVMAYVKHLANGYHEFVIDGVVWTARKQNGVCPLIGLGSETLLKA